MDAGLVIVLQGWLVLRGLLVNRPNEHQNPLISLLIGETHHADAPLRFSGLGQSKSRVAGGFGSGDGVCRIDHDQQLAELVGEDCHLLFFDEVSLASEVTSSLDVKNARAWSTDVVGSEDLGREILGHVAIAGPFALTANTMGPSSPTAIADTEVGPIAIL